MGIMFEIHVISHRLNNFSRDLQANKDHEHSLIVLYPFTCDLSITNITQKFFVSRMKKCLISRMFEYSKIGRYAV